MLDQIVVGLVVDLVAQHVVVAAVVPGHRLPHPRVLALEVAADVVGEEVVHRDLDRMQQVEAAPARGRPKARAPGARRPQRRTLAVPRRAPLGVEEGRAVRVGVHVHDHAQARVGEQVDDPVGPGQVGLHGGRVVGVGAAREPGERGARCVRGAVARVVDPGVGRPGLEPLPDDPQPHHVEAQLDQRGGVGGGEPAPRVIGVGREHVGQPRPLGGPDARSAGHRHVHRAPTALGHQVGPVKLERAALRVGEERAALGLDRARRPAQPSARAAAGAMHGQCRDQRDGEADEAARQGAAHSIRAADRAMALAGWTWRSTWKSRQTAAPSAGVGWKTMWGMGPA